MGYRPAATKFDFSMKLEDTTLAIAKVTKALDDKSFVIFAFRPSDNVQWLKLETAKLVNRNCQVADIEIK